MKRVSTPIAIVGMACRFAGHANSIDKFWRNITSKRDCITPIPANRWDSRIFDRLESSESTQFAKVGGFIESVDSFDAAFFGITDREARDIDPQQRILLELAWCCMQDAGVSPQYLQSVNTGVFTGVINHDYERLMLSDHQQISSYTGLGRANAIAANRISYTFNLTGPSVTIDTACSSSLTAIDSACQALDNAVADAAFAGGVNVIGMPESYIEFSRASMLSKAGRCSAFDDRADGFVRAEGGGLVLLKRLSDALVDGDRIYATIVSTSVNQDGKTAGLMAPGADAQKNMMRTALEQCNLSADDVGYVEAHGTGTQAGDVIEAHSIGEVYAGQNRRDLLPIGSVKTNIGHSESAAGIAGLIKAVLAVKNAIIPPNLNFSNANRNVDFEKLRLRVPTESQRWAQRAGKRRVAAVNSFGFGGANAHAIVAQVPEPVLSDRQNYRHPLLFPISAASAEQLKQLKGSVETQIDINPQAHENLSYTAGRQPVLKYRNCLVLDDNNAVCEITTQAYDAQCDRSPDLQQSDNRNLAFVFNGLGGHLGDAGRQLFQTEPVFRSIIDLCDSILKQRYQLKCVSEFFTRHQRPLPDDIVSTHCVHFTLQTALFELWKSWNVTPSTVMGHSLGEVAAACAAGCISIYDAIKIVVNRASALNQFTRHGAMLATAVSMDKALELVGQYKDELFIAAHNCDQSITFAGTNKCIKRIENKLSKSAVFCRVLEIHVPFHCRLIDSARDEVIAKTSGFSIKPRRLNWISSVSGKTITEDEIDSEFWWNNFREPVRFRDAMDTAVQNGICNFVEIGSHPTLSYSIVQCLQTKGVTGRHFQSLNQQKHDCAAMRTSVAELFCAGVDIDWRKINPPAQIVAFAEHHWERKRYWIEPQNKTTSISGQTNDSVNYPSLITSCDLSSHHWEMNIDIGQLAWLRKHTIRGEIVYPAAGYIESALQAGQQTLGTTSLEVSDIQFRQMLAVDSKPTSEQRKFLLEINNTENDNQLLFTVRSSCVAEPIIFCRGQLQCASVALDTDGIVKKFKNADVVDTPQNLFDELERMGLQAERTSWLIRKVKQINGEELLAKIDAGASVRLCDQQYLLDPGLLDLCFRLSWLTGKINREIYLPEKIERICYMHRPGSEVWCHLKVISKIENVLILNLTIFSDTAVIAQVSGLQLRALQCTDALEQDKDPQIVLPTWVPTQLAATHQAWFEPLSDSHCETIQKFCDTAAVRNKRHAYYSHVADQLTAVALSFIGDCFRCGGISNRNDVLTIRELKKNLRVAKTQEPLFGSLLALLERAAYVQIKPQTDNSPSANENLVFVKQDLPQGVRQAVVEFTGRFDSAQYLLEVILIERCGRHLPEVLRGEKSGLDVLFPQGDMTDLRKFYRASPTCLIYNEVITAVLRDLLSKWPFERPLKILEIGGGTAAVMFHLENLLTANNVEYTFTDVSSSFIRQARHNFGHLDNVSFDQFDLNADPQVQGFKENHFDIVIANDALHLATNPNHTMSFIDAILVPGGFLLFCEMIKQPDWAHLVFGMLPDWHNTANVHDTTNDTDDLISLWKQTLNSGNFKCTNIAADFVHDNAPLHAVFLAQCSKTDLPVSVNSKADTCKLIFSDSGEFSDRFTTSFGKNKTLRVIRGEQFSKNKQCYSMRPFEVGDYKELFQSIEKTAQQPQEIIILWNFTAPPAAQVEVSQLQTESSFTVMVSCLLKALDELTLALPRLTFVSSNVHQGDGISNLAQCFNAEIWSTGRTIRNEYRQSQCTIVDIDENCDNSIEALVQFIMHNDGHEEVSIRGSKLYVPVLRSIEANTTDFSSDRNYSLVCTEPGNLDSVNFTSTDFPVPSDFQVVVEVQAAALNFRDVMVALDALEQSAVFAGAAQDRLGIECAGVVVQVGCKVTKLIPGDRVVALSPAALSGYVSVNENFAYPLSIDTVGSNQAAGLPVSLITGLYSLAKIPDIGKNSSILIHTASGGVGLMLIALARQKGLRIFATAGSKEKTELLNLLGVEYVSDSRSKRFVEDVLRWTDGRGVDIVVNTLGGTLAEANQHVLSEFGSFIELGKYKDQNVIHQAIGSNNKNTSIHIVDIDRLWKDDPEQLSSLLRESMKLIEQQKLPLLPCEIFTARRAKQAFKSMASAQHIGKCVISMEDLPIARPLAPQLNFVRCDSTYVVSGGAGGFGLATVKWLSHNGAKHIITINRNQGNSQDFQKAKYEMEKSGTAVHHVAADICELSSLKKSLGKAMKLLPQVRGVFHCAMEINDHALTQVDSASYFQSAGAKVIGAWNLYQLTKHLQLDCFVMYSSITSLVGPAGQSAYAAANAFIDSFSSYLTDHGINALSVNWGGVSDCGYVADNLRRSDAINARYGVSGCSAEAMLNKLKSVLMNHPSPQVAIAAGQWANSHNERKSIDSDDRATPSAAKQIDRKSQNGSVSGPNDVADSVYNCICSVIGIPKDQIELEQLVVDLGIDSLQAVELSHQLRTKSNIQISAASLLESVSIQELINMR